MGSEISRAFLWKWSLTVITLMPLWVLMPGPGKKSRKLERTQVTDDDNILASPALWSHGSLPVALDINSASFSLSSGPLTFCWAHRHKRKKYFPTFLVDNCGHVTRFWPMRGRRPPVQYFWEVSINGGTVPSFPFCWQTGDVMAGIWPRGRTKQKELDSLVMVEAPDWPVLPPGLSSFVWERSNLSCLSHSQQELMLTTMEP